MRTWTLAILGSLAAATAAPTQTSPLRFRFEQGQVLTYKVAHQTAVSEVIGGTKVATSSRLNLTKRWQVLAVDRQGTATLQLTLTALRTEQTRPDGEKLLYDSADPDRGTAALKEYMGKFLNQPLAVVKVDTAGKVVAVVKSVANRFDSELPFVVLLPPGPPEVGRSWQRPFQVVLDPPDGTGEKYAAVQKYICKALDSARAVFTLTTSFQALPQSRMDQIPLLRKQPAGEVVFDVTNGRLRSARLLIDRELQDHQGTGSSYHFQSEYTEQYTGP